MQGKSPHPTVYSPIGVMSTNVHGKMYIKSSNEPLAALFTIKTEQTWNKSAINDIIKANRNNERR
jgi:hypothetical protein